MMKSRFLFVVAAAAAALTALPAGADQRYGERPPVVVSPELTAPWVMQLGHKPGQKAVPRGSSYASRMLNGLQHLGTGEASRTQPAARRQGFGLFRRAAAPAPQKQIQPRLDPVYLPQQVDYTGSEKPGTIVIHSASKFLYLVQPGGKARRYGVGVGEEGMTWTGTEKITMKREWPEWRPPGEMIERERAKGRVLPAHMEGGQPNPLGARAMYLGSTLYRIHGTNAPWTIGTNVSSGCIRLRNEDVVDLYERVSVGTTVVVM
jgi:lipoprotein-anchoring transpeptidase ErfK/SrfK